jgi:C4-dicarboxylate-specific signal transduction histidine kinase
LFLPVIWSAVRFGFEGATSTLLVTQVGLILTIQLAGHRAFDLATYQTAMIVLSLTGLSVGMLVSEQQAAEQQLRQHQDALARSARASSMGEFAAAIAHEINQPLAAIGNYARTIDRAARAEPIETATVREAAGKTVAQVERAAEVVRRLRELIQAGRIVLNRHAVARIISESVALCETDFHRHVVQLDVSIGPGIPDVAVDRLQIEQVIVNLLRNAMEALFEAGRSDGKVTVSATAGANDMITIAVEDNGPGFPTTAGMRDNAVLTSTKTGGMGLGLALSRSIVEAHGGRLTIHERHAGALVSLTVRMFPTEPRKTT